jgi:hypothetical protein
MSERNVPPGDETAGISRDELLSAMFANMVVQQAQMAMVLLGKVAHPDTGEFVQDIDTARMFIDQLEMLEAKTKGNLSAQEERLLRQALGSLRMAFVEAVDGPAGKPQVAPETAAPAAPESKPETTPDAGTAGAAPATDAAAAAAQAEESRKKFSKKY